MRIASKGTSAMWLVLVATLAVTLSMSSPAVSPDGITPAERLSLEPGRRGEVLLTRRDVYAPGAAVLVMDGSASREAPRSSLAFLFGDVAGDEATRVLVSVDPQATRLHAFTRTPDGWTELRQLEEERSGDYLLAPSPGFLDPSMEHPGFTCGQPELPEPPPESSFHLDSAAPGTEAATALRQVTLAVDTDNELLSLEFSDDTASAAMMLSGKQSSPTSASGIGYVNTLCSSSGGYTFSQVFKYAGSTASSDVLLVAHEVGHNFGSSHTHCYLDPTPIDTCYSGESGCYSGPTSCPPPQTINGVANVRGTLMSYCHLLSGCSSSAVFHPRTVALLDPIVASKVGVCVFPAAGTNPKEASPLGTMTAQRGAGGAIAVTYAPACGATQHTVYAGNLATLRTGGLAWSQRFCSLGSSGSLSFTPSGDVYFVVAGNNGTTEGSYGRASAGERPAGGSGGACSYVQDLSGTCP